MFKEALQIGHDDSQIKRAIKRAIKDAKIAMITDDDVDIITSTIFAALRNKSGSGPKKGQGIKASSPRVVKKIAKGDDIEALKDHLGQMDIILPMLARKNLSPEMTKNQKKSFNAHANAARELLTKLSFENAEQKEAQYNDLVKKYKEILGINESLQESLNIDLTEDDIAELIYKATSNSDVSDFLRMSQKEMAKITWNVYKALQKLDISYEKPSMRDNAEEREKQAMVTEAKKKNKNCFEKKNAGNVEKGIDIFNSSFGEEYSNKDAIYILNRLDEADRPDGAPINFWEPGGEDAEEYYQINILTDMFDADPSRFEQALRDFGYDLTNYDNFDSFLKEVDKEDLLNKFADLLQKNDQLNSSWYDHFDFTEAPLPFDLEEDVDINNQLISYSDLKKEVDAFKADLEKVDENDLDGVYSQYGYVYRTYRPLVDKCKDILRNISISGYGGIRDVEKVKIYDLCKYMDYNFPFGWKMYKNR